jgi:subtilisin family serine protease
MIFVFVLSTSSAAARTSSLLAGERYSVGYQAGTKDLVVQGVLALGGTIRFEFDNIQALAVAVPAGQAGALAGLPGVTGVQETPVYHLHAQTVPYGIDMIGARDTWDANRNGTIDAGAPTGKGMKVCIIDTGIYAAHEDLGGGKVKIQAGSSWVGEQWDRDHHGHGTHVAGTVTAKNNKTGVVGVSPGNVTLIVADVFNDAGDGQDAAVILDAANWCAGQGANIISMSLGGPVDDQFLGPGYQALYDRGILVIAAAGNDGGPVQSYPASYPSVVSVAAVDDSGTVAEFSNFVPEVELAAPGVNVLSTWPSRDEVSVAGGPTFSANPVEFADPVNTATGVLANGGSCDLPVAAGTFTGQLVLCQRGGLPFRAKIDNAAAGGAAAVILWNNEPGNFSGTYAACCSPILAVSLSMEDGQVLVDSWLGASATIRIHAESARSYTFLSGTSMATPHVSGAAAVLWSACPALTNDQVRSHLDAFVFEPASDSLAGRDIFYGYGIPQLNRAVAALSDGVNNYDPNSGNGDGNNPANVECP